VPFLKRFFSFLLSFFILVGVVSFSEISASTDSKNGILKTAATEKKLDIKAKSVILMEPNTSKILYEDNADEVLPPASITKVMSLLLVMEAMERGDFDLETVVTASEHACSMGGSQIWLEPGESMTVNDLLKAAVIVSANDATVALGELVAGSEEGFVALMNEKAAELGMNNTKFINCTGLDAEGHLTSAHDVAIMSSELIKHEKIKEYTTVWMDSLRDGESELVNTNKLVRFYQGTTGLKTGTTSTSGYCLSATAERNSMELVAVVMGGETTDDRFNGAKKLLDYGFANYSYVKVKSELEKDFTVNVEKGIKGKAYVKADEIVGVLLKKTDSAQIEREIIIDEKIEAPLKKGDKIGSVVVTLSGEQIGEIPIVLNENIDRLTFKRVFIWLLKGLFVL